MRKFWRTHGSKVSLYSPRITRNLNAHQFKIWQEGIVNYESKEEESDRSSLIKPTTVIASC